MIFDKQKVAAALAGMTPQRAIGLAAQLSYDPRRKVDREVAWLTNAVVALNRLEPWERMEALFQVRRAAEDALTFMTARATEVARATEDAAEKTGGRR